MAIPTIRQKIEKTVNGIIVRDQKPKDIRTPSAKRFAMSVGNRIEKAEIMDVAIIKEEERNWFLKEKMSRDRLIPKM